MAEPSRSPVGPILKSDAYLAWRRRQQFGQSPEHMAGLPLGRWSAWVAAQEPLVGVPVAELAPWPTSARQAPFPHDEAAATAVAERVRLLGDLADAVLSAEEKTQGRERAWLTLRALRDEVTLLQALTDSMARRWYAGHTPLFPAIAQDLAVLVEGVGHAAGLLARTGVDTFSRNASVEHTPLGWANRMQRKISRGRMDSGWSAITTRHRRS